MIKQTEITEQNERMAKNNKFMKDKAFMIEIDKDIYLKAGDLIICEIEQTIASIQKCTIIQRISNA